jgi:hypothetical protein
VGALDIVEDGRTGVLFDKQTKESIIGATCQFEKMKFNEEHIRESAKRFSGERFEKGLLGIINEER